MKSPLSALDRRHFLRLASAAAAGLSGVASESLAQSAASSRPAVAAPTRPRAGRGLTKNRKNYVGVQVRGFGWVDEGVDSVLDNLQNKGDVNTIWAYTYAYGERRLTKGVNLPDHGKALAAGDTTTNAGALYDYDPRFFTNTVVKDFRITGYGKFNVIEEVAPKAHARGMDFFAWDLNNPSPTMVHTAPGYSTLGEVDVYGRVTTNPCFNNPDYQHFLSGKIESLLIGYPDLVDGVAWGCERMGPLDSIISGSSNATCFCQFCQARARTLGINIDRARAGFLAIIELFRRSPAPLDGYFVTFWRTLLHYPEVLQWEMLWTNSFQDQQRSLYGLAKSIAPAKPFGFHLMQNMTFSPFYRAEEDYTERKEYADFFKIATYNNAGGPRMHTFLQNLSRTVFHDATPEDFTPLYYKIMNYHEAPFDQLASAGLTPGYIAEETHRALAQVDGMVQIYPGIDINVPVLGNGPKTGDKVTTPEDVSKALRAAFAAGADGVILSREYVEMYLANLTAAGNTLREIFSAQRPERS
ncbi:MAG TPA: hypothetical protein VG714_09590 [Acidobacteriaceae bacterium]|nr:hypothetical protein [Acidobacteriaceae bacterium]